MLALWMCTAGLVGVVVTLAPFSSNHHYPKVSNWHHVQKRTYPIPPDAEQAQCGLPQHPELAGCELGQSWYLHQAPVPDLLMSSKWLSEQLNALSPARGSGKSPWQPDTREAHKGESWIRVPINLRVDPKLSGSGYDPQMV